MWAQAQKSQAFPPELLCILISETLNEKNLDADTSDQHRVVYIDLPVMLWSVLLSSSIGC